MNPGRRQLAAALCLWSVLFLLPFGRASEIPILIGALYALAAWAREPRRILAPRYRLALLAVTAYWLPEFVSAFDSIARDKSWMEVATDLRYVPFAMFTVDALATTPVRRQLVWWSALLLAFWILDALLQSTFGVGFGGALETDRVSGIFGDDNLKLGPVLAVLSPLPVLVALDRYGRRVAALVWLLAAIAVLLAGARGGWISFAVVTLALLWRIAQTPRRFAMGLLVASLVGAAAGSVTYALSDRFAARVDRTLAVFDGTRAGLENALAYRASIWETALDMSLAHPFNGVGVRAFRYDYIAHAAADDQWLAMNPGQGAFHAHQWLLEVASETGAFGLACWIALLGLLWRHWRCWSRECRHAAAPYSIALLAMLFPLNTHFAFYSSFWSNLYFWPLLVWIAQLPPARERPP
jgi:O-antigen ligase